MELLLKLTPAITSVLFSLGGSGWKFARRYLLPLFMLTLLYTCIGNLTIQSLIACILVCIGLHLPYGDSLPNKLRYLIRCLVIATWFAPLLLVSCTTLSVVLTICSTLLLTILFWISNQKWGEKWCAWYVWEPTAGFLLGLNLIMITPK